MQTICITNHYYSLEKLQPLGNLELIQKRRSKLLVCPRLLNKTTPHMLHIFHVHTLRIISAVLL